MSNNKNSYFHIVIFKFLIGISISIHFFSLAIAASGYGKTSTYRKAIKAFVPLSRLERRYNMFLEKKYNDMLNKAQTSNACVPWHKAPPREGTIFTQLPISATSNVGNPALVVNRSSANYQCADTILANTWRKTNLTSASYLEFTVETPVYPKSVTIKGIQGWFTRLEAFDGTKWKTIWMGESSWCVTEMMVRQITFKASRYRLTSPMGREGGVYSIEVKGMSDIFPVYPLCSSVGNVCEPGSVCTGSTVNSWDTAQCCATACTSRPYAFNLGMLIGGDSRDQMRIANSINVNFVKSEGDSWWSELPGGLNNNETSEILDFHDKLRTANRSAYLSGEGTNVGIRYNSLNGYLAQAKMRSQFPHIRGTFFDDASNFGYVAIANMIKPILEINPKEKFFLTIYSPHSSYGLLENFGPTTAVGKSAFLANFGTSIPCAGSPTYNTLAGTYPFNQLGNPPMIGSYVSSYTSAYCLASKYKVAGVWDPNNASFQNQNWANGIKAGTRGFLFWNPLMYSVNGRDRSYYGGTVFPFSFAPRLAPSQAYSWTPPGVIVPPSVNALKVMMDDLCPSCRLCTEDKVYKEDGYFGGACCADNEVAIGNRCADVSAKIQWSTLASRNQLEGPPASNFACYSGRTNSSLVSIEPQKDEIFELEYATAVYPETIVLYGKNLGAQKIEGFDGEQWIELSSSDPGTTCIQSISIPRESSFLLKKLRISFAKSSTTRGLDSVALVEMREIQNFCQ